METSEAPSLLLTLLVGLLPSALVGIFTLGGVYLTQRSQAARDERTRQHDLTRDRASEERRLRDERRQRLRRAYATVLNAALKVPSLAASAGLVAAHAKQLKKEGSMEAQRSAFRQLLDTMSQQVGDTSDARVELILDGEDETILDLFGRLTTHRIALDAAVASDYLGDRELEDFETQVRAMDATAKEITQIARRRLAELEQPL
jgi:hypothetical protein